MDSTSVGVVCAILIVIAAYVVYSWAIPPAPKTLKPPTTETYEPPGDFRIFNYFHKHSIKVEVLVKILDLPNDVGKVPNDSTTAQYETHVLAERIAPQKTGGLARCDVLKYFVLGNVIKIYLIDPITNKQRPYTTYLVNTEPKTFIKNLHVGMMTARFLGSTDSLRMSTTAGNAVNGCAYVKIHNVTDIPLKLNDDIEVAPHSTTRYQGYLHQGITLGFYFKDPDGLYPTFQYLQPNSDIFYGVVSDIPQTLEGCWQTEYSDLCEYGQVMWPFQVGVM